MKKYSTGISIVSVVISVITFVCLFCIRFSEFNVDWYGFLVGILALLVTVLIGWQVFNAIQMQNTLKDIDSKMRKEIDEYDYTVNALLSQLHTIQASFDRYHNKQALEGFMEALGSAVKGSRSESAIEGILSYLLAVQERCILHKEKIYLSKIKKEDYIRILSGIKGRDAQEMRSFVESLDVLE